MSKWCMLAVAAALALPCSAVLADANDGGAVIAADGGRVLVIRDAGENPDSQAAQVQAIQAEIQALQHQLAELQAANPAPAPKADRPVKIAPDGAKTFSAADIKAAMDQVKANVSSDTWFPLRKKVAALDGRRVSGPEALELLAPLKPEVGPEGWELLQKTFAVAPAQGPKSEVRDRIAHELAERRELAERSEKEEAAERLEVTRRDLSEKAPAWERRPRGDQGEAAEVGEGLKVIVNGQELKLNPGQMMPPKKDGLVSAWVQAQPKPRMEMKPRGENKYGFLGVVPGEVCPPLAAQLGLHDGRGVVVEQVSEGSAAEKAGLRQYDVLTQINDQILYDITQLKKLVAAQRPGTTVRVELIREGRRQSLSATLGGTAVQSWAKEEEEECECEAGEGHEKGEGPAHRGGMPFHFQFNRGGFGQGFGGFGGGFGGFGQGFGGGQQGQFQPGGPFCPMPFGSMPGAQFGGNATFRVQPGNPGQPGQPGQPGMPVPPQVNTWLYGKPGAPSDQHKAPHFEPRSEGGARGEVNGETEELKLFVNGKEFKVGPGNTVTLPPGMTAPVPPQR